ncbi:PaaI family thioesterase [Thermophilibacter provencensis]|uniref:PaaI family thioesterase n=1 Tax=Thermophilibacter provencensis TaxID=1852386 RepID=UPI002354591B|nr:PaaI family thioesterase [Thermophilibacter provencensis]
MALIGEDASLEEVQRVFRNDRFATDACGCRVVEASRGHAVCEFDITPGHRNEKGGVMGGAIFTVADLAFAVASNVGEPVTVSVSSSIEFMSAAKGERLIATADVDKNGRTLGFYNCLVTYGLGTACARVTQTAMHLRQ